MSWFSQTDHGGICNRHLSMAVPHVRLCRRKHPRREEQNGTSVVFTLLFMHISKQQHISSHVPTWNLSSFVYLCIFLKWEGGINYFRFKFFIKMTKINLYQLNRWEEATYLLSSFISRMSLVISQNKQTCKAHRCSHESSTNFAAVTEATLPTRWDKHQLLRLPTAVQVATAATNEAATHVRWVATVALWRRWVGVLTRREETSRQTRTSKQETQPVEIMRFMQRISTSQN